MFAIIHNVDDIAAVLAQLGKGALLAKVDIESAYRLIPVHPHDRPLQAVRWDGNIYIDPMLPFGLRSAAKIFNAVADALHWYLHQSGIPLVCHYLDDFVIIGPPHSPQCAHSLLILLSHMLPHGANHIIYVVGNCECVARHKLAYLA